jgi:hypothetical protein
MEVLKLAPTIKLPAKPKQAVVPQQQSINRAINQIMGGAPIKTASIPTRVQAPAAAPVPVQAPIQVPAQAPIQVAPQAPELAPTLSQQSIDSAISKIISGSAAQTVETVLTPTPSIQTLAKNKTALIIGAVIIGGLWFMSRKKAVR